jgi:hypothetical protein
MNFLCEERRLAGANKDDKGKTRNIRPQQCGPRACAGKLLRVFGARLARRASKSPLALPKSRRLWFCRHQQRRRGVLKRFCGLALGAVLGLALAACGKATAPGPATTQAQARTVTILLPRGHNITALYMGPGPAHGEADILLADLTKTPLAPDVFHAVDIPAPPAGASNWLVFALRQDGTTLVSGGFYRFDPAKLDSVTLYDDGAGGYRVVPGVRLS